MDITASTLSVNSINAFIKEREQRKQEEERKRSEAAKAEREKLHKAFLTDNLPSDTMDRVASMMRKAVEANENEALMFQFPSAWLPDAGRSITNHAADWPAHLTGLAQRAYAFYEQNLKPRGFELRAEILNWPDGMPGDVGLFLRWKGDE